MAGRDVSTGPPVEATFPDEPYYVVREEYDPSDLSTLVVEAVAEATDIDPMSVEVPLSRGIDPDALNQLFDEHDDGEPRNSGRVTFRLWGMTITVHSEGQVVVYPPDYEDAP